MTFAPWTDGEPKDFIKLFRFYHEYVTVLYSTIQTENKLPEEVLFELHAALNHISRHWAYDENEASVVTKAYGHLKRCCLDIFKLKLKETRRQYDELLTIDTSVIDNGNFDRDLRRLGHEIKTEATEARRLEGQITQDDETVSLFEPWERVFVKCDQLEREFYLHPHIEWAKKREISRSHKRYVAELISAFIVGVVSSLVAAYILIRLQQ